MRLRLGCFCGLNFCGFVFVALAKLQNSTIVEFCSSKPQKALRRAFLVAATWAAMCATVERVRSTVFFFFLPSSSKCKQEMICVRSHGDRTQFLVNDAVFDRFESERKQHQDMASSHELAISMYPASLPFNRSEA